MHLQTLSALHSISIVLTKGKKLLTHKDSKFNNAHCASASSILNFKEEKKMEELTLGSFSKDNEIHKISEITHLSRESQVLNQGILLL